MEESNENIAFKLMWAVSDDRINDNKQFNGYENILSQSSSTNDNIIDTSILLKRRCY